MSSELLVALAGSIGSMFGSVAGAICSAKVLTYRVAQLEQKMKDQCENCTVMDDRVDKIEKEQAVVQEKLIVVNHRIDNIEKREGVKA